MRCYLHCTVETSDHDGYCSGAECEYERYNVILEVSLPESIADMDLDSHYWDKYIEKYKNSSLSSECIDNNLSVHDSNIVIDKIVLQRGVKLY